VAARFVIDYRAWIIGKQEHAAGSTYVSGVIDIEALRDHRAPAQWDNWLKDLRTELYQLFTSSRSIPRTFISLRCVFKVPR
jgi:beta-ureidopropionase